MTGASFIVSSLIFLSGIILVMWSVDKFVDHLAPAAVGIGVSVFLLTIVLAGTDIENAVLGVAAAVGGLPDVAIGTVFGEALFILGAAVGLAGVMSPFEIQTPRRYLLLTAISPTLLLLTGADTVLSRSDGLILTATFPLMLWLLYRWESSERTRFIKSDELNATREPGGRQGAKRTRSGIPLQLTNLLLTIVGMTIGSELAVIGTHGILKQFNLDGLAFGATIMSFIASLEEIMLTAKPVREGKPEIGIGNVIGSMLFFMTANAGVIALVHPLTLSRSVFEIQWPLFLLALALVLLFLLWGRIGRFEGMLMLLVYA